MSVIINKGLIEAVNKQGMVVRDQKKVYNGYHDEFGQFTEVVIEGSQYRITFLSTAFNENPVNYFRITKVEDLYRNRTYRSPRYFFKFIGLVQGINSSVFLHEMESKRP
mgnify:FL=1